MYTILKLLWISLRRNGELQIRLNNFALTKTASGLGKKNVLLFNKKLMSFPFLKNKN